MDIDFDINEIVDDATTDFDLEDRLRKITRRERDVSVYTDEKIAEKLGGAEDERDFSGIVTGRRRWGVLGEIDRLLAEVGDIQEAVKLYGMEPDAEKLNELAADVAKLKVEIPELRARLKESEMVFHLRAVPDDLVKGARREARKLLKLTSKGIPEDVQETYNEVYTAVLLSKIVVSYDDALTGRTGMKLGVKGALRLQGQLPFGEFPKLDRAMVELQFENAISDKATTNPDF